jgi:SPP1 gp7 family putative phage head morphogenesis protein
MDLFSFLPKQIQNRLSQKAIVNARPVDLMNALGSKLGSGVSIQIVPETVSRNREDINTWLTALKIAEDIKQPRRGDLLRVYESVLIDAHLSSALETRTLKLLATKWRVVTSKGVDEEKSRLFESPWFYAYMKYFMEAIYYGHSFLEFSPPINGEFNEITLVNRRHIRPELGQYVIKESDSTGIQYRGTQVMDWCIEIGNAFDLGLLKKASPHALWKKNALAAWSEFDEKFGVPFRIVKTNSRDNKRLNTLKSVMQNMGSAGWAILQDDETMQLLETAGGDVYKCFDMLIARANSEMSKLILGQTMTADEGGSMAQAKVHLEVMEDRYHGDLAAAKYNLNWSLLPFMVKHGYKLSPDDRIEPDLSTTLLAKDQAEIYSKLLLHYDISAKHAAQTFGIPESEIELKQNFNKPVPSSTRVQAMRVTLPNYTFGECAVCGGNHLPYQVENSLTDRINEMLITESWENRPNFNQEYFTWLQSQFNTGLNQGYSTRLVEINYNAADYSMLNMMQANLFNFSGAKTVGTLVELNRLATDAANFDAFKKDARNLLGQVNGQWMKTEYNFTVLASENAANWQRQKATIEDFPYLKYITAGDNRVREAHAELDGTLYKKTDPVISYVYPPNAYGCRCIMADEEDKNAGTFFENGRQAIDLLSTSGIDKSGRSEWDRMVRGGFAINRGEASQIFMQNQFYVNSYNQRLSYSELGQKPYSKIKGDKSSFLAKSTSAQDWHGKNTIDGFAPDYAKRPVSVDLTALERTLKTKEGADVTLAGVSQTLKSPDEVYVFAGNSLDIKYLKFYNNTTIEVVAIAKKDQPLTLVSFREVPANEVDAVRNGLLVKTSK